MKDTAPAEFEQIRHLLPVPDCYAKQLIEKIVSDQVCWAEEYAKKYWALAYWNRATHSYEDGAYDTSFETYLRGELHTYSLRTLKLYDCFIRQLLEPRENLIFRIMDSTVRFYGYVSIGDASAQKRRSTSKTSYPA